MVHVRVIELMDQRWYCFGVQHGESRRVRAWNGKKGIPFVRRTVVEIRTKIAAARRDQWRNNEHVARGFTEKVREPAKVGTGLDQTSSARGCRVVHGLVHSEKVG